MANMQPYQFIKTLKFLYTIIKNFRQIANNLPYKKIEISKVQQETVNRNHNETRSRLNPYSILNLYKICKRLLIFSFTFSP